MPRGYVSYWEMDVREKIEAGWNAKQLFKAYPSLTYCKVHSIAKKTGLKTLGQLKKRELTEEEKNKIKELRQNGLSIINIAKEIKWSRDRTSKLIRENHWRFCSLCRVQLIEKGKYYHRKRCRKCFLEHLRNYKRNISRYISAGKITV